MNEPIILCIETATKNCSVALFKGKELLAIKEQGGVYSHAENLTVFISEIFKEANLSYHQLDAIAVSKGPGSYTGLRIGVSTTKGLAFALQKPIIAVDTLYAMASLAAQDYRDADICFCPMIDARRMEVYCAIYDKDLSQLKPVTAEIITENVFDKFIGNKKMILFGDGAMKCKDLFINKENYIFTEKEYISSKGLIDSAIKKWFNKVFEDVVYFEPFYLKEFVSIKTSN
jgi:tRNA threonylcarbamoyladenosine biosynthesis protein TsaB